MKNADHIQQWCKEYYVDLTVRSQYHYTLTFENRRLDLFLSKKGIKFHDLSLDRRGVIDRLVEFLDAWLERSLIPKLNKNDLLATYINNRFGTELTPQHAADIAKYILTQYK